MTIGTRDQFKRAIGRAVGQGGHRNVIDLGGGRYRVVGRQRTPYTVTVDADGEYYCTCPAGKVGTPCWHAASAWMTLVQRAAFRPLAPAATASSGAVAPAVAPTWNPPTDEWDRIADPVTRRPNGRGIGFAGADPSYAADEPVTLGELLAGLRGAR